MRSHRHMDRKTHNHGILGSAEDDLTLPSVTSGLQLSVPTEPLVQLLTKSSQNYTLVMFLWPFSHYYCVYLQ